MVIPSYTSSPKHLKISEENHHIGEFIGERAERILYDLTSFGEKSLGSDGHRLATEYLLNKVSEIVVESRSDLYDIEVDHQISSGQKASIVYKDVSNIVIKLTPKNRQSHATLLVNSHYDSEYGSPGAGDNSIMVAVQLEVFRVIASAEKPLYHPIVFLFNGAEEAESIGSHSFVTRQKWTKDVKAVINLDSAGNGGRDIVFQSGPNHPWLMRYYKESVAYPFASTIAEELFQRGLIPSYTDFAVFNDHKIPGLDIAHIDNGYVYHSKYDRFSIMTKRTYQLTGSNVLALTRSLANAKELDDMKVSLLSFCSNSSKM